MNRVFQISEIETMCQDLKTILEQCKEHVSAMQSCADKVESALGEVRAKWEKVTENAQAAVEKLLASVKGAETICQVFSKDPVNLSTGNFIYDRTDLEIPGREPFGFRRFYNAWSSII